MTIEELEIELKDLYSWLHYYKYVDASTDYTDEILLIETRIKADEKSLKIKKAIKNIL